MLVVSTDMHVCVCDYILCMYRGGVEYCSRHYRAGCYYLLYIYTCLCLKCALLRVIIIYDRVVGGREGMRMGVQSTGERCQTNAACICNHPIITSQQEYNTCQHGQVFGMVCTVRHTL